MKAPSSPQLSSRTSRRQIVTWSIAGLVLALVIPTAWAADADDVARQLATRSGVQRGLCAMLGADDDLALALARSTGLLVHVRDTRAESVVRLRRLAAENGYGIDRIVAERSATSLLPHADNLLDTVVTTQWTGDSLGRWKATEILRAMRPEGTALIGVVKEQFDGGLPALRAWASAGEPDALELWSDDRWHWVSMRKPRPSEVDDWSHWEHGPDNNPVSSDRVIRAPYMTQYMAKPYYIGMPSITTAAAGRTFLAIGHIAHHEREWGTLYRLIARNGYNGTVLWERALPDGYAVHRSTFIATRETFYMIDGDHCLLLDAQTGAEQGRISLPVAGHWKWMALRDGVLYALIGKPEPGTKITKGDRTVGGWSWQDLSPEYYGSDVPIGYGHTLVAYRLSDRQLLWQHREETPIDSRGMAMVDQKMVVISPAEHIRCLDTTSGKVVWTNSDKSVRELIEQPGQGLTSTPGFRTQCLVVASPQALVIQGQTRMNVVALATDDGRQLWTKRKITNNPNAIFVEGHFVLGVGPGGSHVTIDPLTGTVGENLKFRKAACTRLTACQDSFFCRGEGTLRYDRNSHKVLIDGGQRPACNDGALPANGLLYLGPWQCDCNLTLIGNIAKCSANNFDFDHVATEDEHLERGPAVDGQIAALEVDDRDWPTFRADSQRTGSSPLAVSGGAGQRWRTQVVTPFTPTAPVAAGGLIFSAGSDGVVRAIEAESGAAKWQFETAGPILAPPTIWNGRLYVGSGDGYAYALEARTGHLLWRFRGGPAERQIMVYGHLCSTWPINTGILVDKGVAYFAAGIIDQDGTYVFALDAETGKIIWQNNSSGHLNSELRKGVSAQGNLALLGNQLLMAGGNQVSPAIYDTATGECRAGELTNGRPKANNGQFVGVFANVSAIVGGRILYSAPENVATKGGFVAFGQKNAYRLNHGGIPPAWNDELIAAINFKHGALTAFTTQQMAERIAKGYGEQPAQPRQWLRNLVQVLEKEGAMAWQTDLGNQHKFEVISLAVADNAVVAVLKFQQQFRSQPQWFVTAFAKENGTPIFRHELREDPLPGGLAIDRDGRIIVSMLNGNTLALK